MICLLSPTERVAQLTKTDHLLTLTEAIWDTRVKWRHIGRALKVSSDVLDEIDEDLHLRDDGQRMERVLVEWLHTGKATIHHLLIALEDKSVRRNDITMEIRSREGIDRSAIGLCETNCSACTPSN